MKSIAIDLASYFARVIRQIGLAAADIGSERELGHMTLEIFGQMWCPAAALANVPSLASGRMGLELWAS